jgi:hypothetical protein
LPRRLVAAWPRLATADALLEAGAAIEARDARGCPALHHAAAAGYTDVASLLVDRGAHLAAADADGVTPVDAAAPSCAAGGAAGGAAVGRRIRPRPKRCKVCSRWRPPAEQASSEA